MKLKQIAAMLGLIWAPLYIAPQSGRIVNKGTGNEPSMTPISGISGGVVRVAAALTLDNSYAGKTMVFDIAAGVSVTLPAATGSGDVFRFVVKTTVTSVADVVQVANATDVMAGMLMGCQDGGDTVEGWETASTSDTITLNGSTTGGILGDFIEVQDVAAGLFSVRGQITQTGSQATPFSAAVS